MDVYHGKHVFTILQENETLDYLGKNGRNSVGMRLRSNRRRKRRRRRFCL
jgi:hypothetical protein